MADEHGEMEEKQVAILCSKIVQQFKNGDYQKAADSLKNALQKHPDNERLKELLVQFKLKVRNRKIEKLENEAISLIQRGDEEAGQKKFREILKLDPSRTDLKDALGKSRKEVMKEWHLNMQKASIKSAFFYLALACFLVAICYVSAVAWDNGKKIKDAKQHIEYGHYETALAKLNQCGWLNAGEKPVLYDKLLAIKDTLITDADACAEKMEYEKAIQLVKTASRASTTPEEFNEQIELLKKLLADQQNAQRAKREFEFEASKSRDYDSVVETDYLTLEVNTLSSEAMACMSEGHFLQAIEKWNQAKKKHKEIREVSIRVKNEYQEAISARENCRTIHAVAFKANAELEASLIWENVTKTVALANQQFEERMFVEAQRNWVEATSACTEAFELCRRSPSYQKAQEEYNKWGGLKAGMAEGDVLRLLGEPQYCEMGSDGCIFYYQDVPRIIENENRTIQVKRPRSGFIHFTNEGLSVALDIEKKKCEKERTVQNRRYEAELKMTVKDDLRKNLEQMHTSKLSAIEQDYEVRKQALAGGAVPYKPYYFISHWAEPDRDLIKLLLVHPVQENEASANWKKRSKWRVLQVNMEKNDVLKILDLPNPSYVLGEERFRYDAIPEYGEMQFERRGDHILRLVYWKEPFWLDRGEALASHVEGL